MIELSPQQREIVEAPLKPMAVSACAGSGKTATAVRRLAAIRKLLGDIRTSLSMRPKTSAICTKGS